MDNEITDQGAMRKSPVLNIGQAAAYLGLSDAFLRKRKAAGLAPKYCKLGDLLRYRIEDLDEWISSSIVDAPISRAA